MIRPDDFDTVEAYLAALDRVDVTIEAEDLEGRPCSFCGDLIDFADWPRNVVTLDVEERQPPHPPTGYYHRYYFCSEYCLRSAEQNVEWLTGEGEHGDPDKIHESDLEGDI